MFVEPYLQRESNPVVQGRQCAQFDCGTDSEEAWSGEEQCTKEKAKNYKERQNPEDTSKERESPGEPAEEVQAAETELEAKKIGYIRK